MTEIRGKIPDFKINKIKVPNLKEQARTQELIWEHIMKQLKVVDTFIQTEELGWISEKVFKQKIAEGFKFKGVTILNENN